MNNTDEALQRILDAQDDHELVRFVRRHRVPIADKYQFMHRCLDSISSSYTTAADVIQGAMREIGEKFREGPHYDPVAKQEEL